MSDDSDLSDESMLTLCRVWDNREEIKVFHYIRMADETLTMNKFETIKETCIEKKTPRFDRVIFCQLKGKLVAMNKIPVKLSITYLVASCRSASACNR